MYLTFAEYVEFGGELTEAAFDRSEPEAEVIIDWYTFNRLHEEQEYPDRVKLCMAKLIDLINTRAELENGPKYAASKTAQVSSTEAPIKSQSNDGVSITYNSINANNLYEALVFTKPGNEYETTVRLFLNGVKDSKGRNLLYRGLYPGE